MTYQVDDNIAGRTDVRSVPPLPAAEWVDASHKRGTTAERERERVREAVRHLRPLPPGAPVVAHPGSTSWCGVLASVDWSWVILGVVVGLACLGMGLAVWASVEAGGWL